MEPIEIGLVAIAYSFLIKYVEKTGEGLGERTLDQVGKLWQRVKAMPGDTFGALKPGQENPFPEDFDQAIREMEAVANQNPEFKQDIIDVVAVAQEENPEYVEKQLEKIQLPGVTAEKMKINALLQQSTMSGGNIVETGAFVGSSEAFKGSTIHGNVTI
ncbi:MAG: hypothetical protein F6K40_38160 [Okeania sp. SIO3I5]|uniref:hypothetical protein n=1 Tax=Okeania sp. SIO3I5 TaxID=2607805 RepID=UPI0013B8D761|nr:hypothetical protein [Okeania sp. SIO3I5]NEQ41701.1 hypothetical protein [Okeania sp. SIO3I5]